MSSSVSAPVFALFLWLGGAICAASEAASESYLLWTHDASVSANHAPEITSTPPVMSSPAYQYAVEAIDAEGDVLTFSLSDAPAGMAIDAATGVIAWTAVVTQIGDYAPLVTVSDGEGGTASQTISLTVRSEWFPLTVPFLEGVNLTDRTTEQDATVLSLGVGGDMSAVTDIVLPDVPTLFAFSDSVTFHLEYQSSAALFVPASSVAQMAVVDTTTGGEAFDEIQADDLTGLSWQSPAAQSVAATQTMVVQRFDGQFLKIGQMTVDLTAGSVTVCFGDVTP